MNDSDRIRALHQQGRIDAAQAERLLNALGSSDGGQPPTQGEPTTAEAPPERPDFAGIDRWVAVELFACSVRVEVDGDLSEPVADVQKGDVEMKASDDGWRVVQRGHDDESWLDRLANGVRETRVVLRLPARTGVRLDVKAGDVDLIGVPALSGRLAAGDLDASGLEAVDLDVKAGDVDLALNPSAGAHRVHLAVGDLEVRLPQDADVRVEGHVSIGDASARPPLQVQRVGLVAATLSGTLGEGRARLRLDVGTGDLDVRTGDNGN